MCAGLQFVVENWGKLATLGVALIHAAVLHRRELAAINDYARRNGGMLRVGLYFFWMPGPTQGTLDKRAAAAEDASKLASDTTATDNTDEHR